METELILSVGGLPPLSARGCRQELMPIQPGLFRRTINGTLVYLGQKSHQRYRSIITCQDKVSIASEGLWPGQLLRIGCIQRLWQKASGLEVLLERTPIDGSVMAIDSQQTVVRVLSQVGSRVRFSPHGKTVFVSYRPWLDVRIIHFSLFTNEWDLKVGWRLEVEEA